MKKILSLVLVVLNTISTHSENSYTIFRLKGEIQRCIITSDIWETISTRDTVKLSDKIYIPEGGSISILASETGIIYSSSKEGRTDVKHIIDLSKESLKSTLIAGNKELFKSKTRNSGNRINRVHGATSRGKNKGHYLNEKKLAKKILNGSKQLKLDLVEENNNYKFRVNAREKCKICIVCSNNGSVSLCLPAEGVWINKGETVLQLPEVIPSKEAVYRIFKVKYTFEESELCRQISHMIMD